MIIIFILKVKRVMKMPKMKKCTVCNKMFLSYNGIEVCSTTCAIERKHRQDEKGNERRRYGLSNSNFEKICPICGKAFETIHSKYCSEKCSAIARNKNISENNKEYYDLHRSSIIEKSKNNRKRKK